MGEEREGWERMREMGAERIKKRGKWEKGQEETKISTFSLVPHCFAVIRIN